MMDRFIYTQYCVQQKMDGVYRKKYIMYHWNEVSITTINKNIYFYQP